MVLRSSAEDQLQIEDIHAEDAPTPKGDDLREFLGKLREQGIHLPVIVVSGFLNDEAIRELIRDGVEGIFIKPLNIFSLLKKASEILEARAKAFAATRSGESGPAVLSSIGGVEGSSDVGKRNIIDRFLFLFKENILHNSKSTPQLNALSLAPE